MTDPADGAAPALTPHLEPLLRGGDRHGSDAQRDTHQREGNSARQSLPAVSGLSAKPESLTVAGASSGASYRGGRNGRLG